MNSTDRRGIIFSIILHATFFLLICFSFLSRSLFEKKVVKHTFKLQIIPQNLENKKIVSKADNNVIIEEKKKTNNEIKKEINVKKIPVEKNTISYNDFIKNKKPIVKKEKEVKLTSKPVEIPKIKATKIETNLQKKLSSINTLSANDLIEYESYLYSMIDSAWECPKSFQDYKNSALFVFEVDKVGRIIKVRVSQSSGSRVFDESVAQAFKKIVSVKPNPTGKSTEFQLTFSKK